MDWGRWPTYGKRFQHPAASVIGFRVASLRGEFICYDPSPDGTQAIIALIEENDERHIVRCLVRGRERTDIGGLEEDLAYLNERYGGADVVFVSRMTTLYGPTNA